MCFLNDSFSCSSAVKTGSRAPDFFFKLPIILGDGGCGESQLWMAWSDLKLSIRNFREMGLSNIP